MSDLKIIDLSHWQGEHGAPIEAMVRAGAALVIVKASQSTFEDPAYRENARTLRRLVAAGKCEPGYYHFLVADNADDQARFFAQTVGDPAGAYVMLDVERVPDPESDPHPRADDPDFGDAKLFIRTLQRLWPKKRLKLYTSEGYWNSLGNPDASDLDVDLHLARYVRTSRRVNGKLVRGTLDFDTSGLTLNANFGGWDQALMRQYGPSAVASLYPVDTNFFRGTRAELHAICNDVTTPSGPVDHPARRRGYNALLDQAIQRVPSWPSPFDGTPTNADDKGWAKAQADVAEAVSALRLAAP